MAGISLEQNVAELERIAARSALGAAAAANAMAKYIAERTAHDTLTRRRNPPGTWYKARPGEPPSYGTGALARSMYSHPASGGLRASAVAGSSDRRARLFEFGSCLIQPRREQRLHWKDSGGWWSHPVLRVDDDHPFLGPTTDEAIDDGELWLIAIEAFRPYDP